jgi:type I restriction enzyme, S subunit
MTGWYECKLGDMLHVKHGFAFLGRHFVSDGSYIVLTPGNFHDSGGFKDKGVNEKWYDGPIPHEYILGKGDVIVAMTEQAEGLLGSSAIIPCSDKYLHNQRLGLIQIKDRSITSSRFIYYLFNSKTVRDQIRGSATGTKVRHTAPTRIADVTVALPSIRSQHRIAGILSAYDDLIQNCQRRIAILEEMARALYREWFVHFRFPGHEDHVFVDSPLGMIPEGWDLKKLSEVAEVNRAQIKAHSAPKELHYIDISSVSPDQIDSITTFSFGDAPGRARRIVQHGDVIWSCVRPNRRSHARVMHPDTGTIASTGFAVLTPTRVPSTFLYFATTTNDFVGYLTNNASGAAYPAVTAATFEKADLVVPSNTLLSEFGDITANMAEQIHVFQSQIRNLRNTRDLLLPRLLSGQIDVEEFES